ncbi:geranylgeranyl transferase type-1 subunit beta [Phoenix dactylifera]|uniref:Geranylgeranyl transferase type-1 subunit beta n=1 Tax=Phoenix dactylifera TaxID=42345 RepID=A0A8B7D3I1_PHODC|nr:geranylgeranyl transferase type-1 subunit beta [Phoenix dactylifera]
MLVCKSKSPRREKLGGPGESVRVRWIRCSAVVRLPPPAMDPEGLELERERHVLFLEMMMERLPSDFETQEINHLTLAYFAISGLGILGALDRVDKDQIASWVLSFQAQPRTMSDLDNGQFYGFHGSRTSQFTIDDSEVSSHNCSHLASTYCALAILNMIGYNLSNINSEAILISMRNLQQPDGSFMPIHFGAEKDLRFVYCAAAICFMLNNWTGMDKEKAKEYILHCQSYDGGFGLVPGSESHGGATYCAVAALQLMGFINADISSKPAKSVVVDVPLLVDWSLQRQAADGGFQGRANKPSDTCYAFWVGGVLKILGFYHFLNKGALRRFLLSCQSKYGGFTKFPENMLPDLYHSYYSFAALSLMEEEGLKPLCVELGITAINDNGI